MIRAEAIFSYPEFGTPHFSRLLTEARELSNKITGPEWHPLARLSNGKFLKPRVYHPIEFQDKNKGEDRIFMGYVDKFPVAVVADGTSSSAQAGAAANEAVLASLDVLSCLLKDELNLADLTEIIEGSFLTASSRIKNKHIDGSTTLLMAFLYMHKTRQGRKEAFWHYGYVGDGRITIISPNRKFRDNFSLEKDLLTPQKDMYTASVNSRGLDIEPSIGCERYTEGDILFCASDGFDSVERQMVEDEGLLLQGVVWRNNPVDGDFPQRLAQDLKKYNYHDDAVLGIIVT